MTIPWQADDEDDGHHVTSLRRSRLVGRWPPPLSRALHDALPLALTACLGLSQIRLGGEREIGGTGEEPLDGAVSDLGVRVRR
jgi:hypothetical protein